MKGLLTTLFVLGVPSFAAAQQGDAGRFLKTRHDTATQILRRAAGTDAERSARHAEVSDLMGSVMDYETIAREALGDHWQTHSPTERQEFVTLLRQLTIRNYRDQIERTLDYEVRFGAEEQVGDATVVRTTARSRQNRRAPAIEIDYRMRRTGDRWTVLDMVTDGASLVTAYQQQFRPILARPGGWQTLLDRLRSRLEQPGAARRP